MNQKTETEFNNWNEKKKKMHIDKQRPFFHEQEIWFCSLGANIGFEQDGRGDDFLRPVLVLKKFNNEVCWTLSMTKNAKSGKYYHTIFLDGREPSALILSQIRLVDAKRLAYKIGSVEKQNFMIIKEKIKQLLA